MTLLFAAAAAPLLPDPDERSPALLTLDPSDVLTVALTLGDWSKVALTRAGATTQGWVKTTDLVAATSVQLFDEPLGAKSALAVGRVEVITSVATWQKIKVTQGDGSVLTGWIDTAGAPKTAPSTGSSLSSSATTSADDVDLVLGANERYRAGLIAAQKLTGIDAAALAALIDAEAEKISSGADAGVWDPRSPNAASGAAGLTQFLASTWCEMAGKPGAQLNVVAMQKGFVGGDGVIVPGMRDALLELRFQPSLSIAAAAEYGLSNLTALQSDGLVAADIGDDACAGFIYLAHHEGLGGARQFLRKQGETSLATFAAQVGTTKANQLAAAAGGDVTAAYRDWLTHYIEQKIQPSRFRSAAAPLNEGGAKATRALAQFSGDALPLSALGGRLDLVIEIQQKLTDLGYLDPPADGKMGPTSFWALAEFCKLNGLSLDGGFTKAIAAALLSPKTLLPSLRAGGSWIDRALAYMTSKGWFLCRHPGAKNIIYLEGVDPNGALNDNAPNVFNDLRMVVSLDATGAPSVACWEGTTEPGTFWTLNPMSPKGAARIAFGQYKAWRVGIHRPDSASAHEALLQCEPIDVYRDLDENFSRQGEIDRGLFGLNQHWGYDAPKDNVGNASAGCLVGRTKAGHREFMALIKADPRFSANGGYKFVTTVMPGRLALAG